MEDKNKFEIIENSMRELSESVKYLLESSNLNEISDQLRYYSYTEIDDLMTLTGKEDFLPEPKLKRLVLATKIWIDNTNKNTMNPFQEKLASNFEEVNEFGEFSLSSYMQQAKISKKKIEVDKKPKGQSKNDRKFFVQQIYNRNTTEGNIYEDDQKEESNRKLTELEDYFGPQGYLGNKHFLPYNMIGDTDSGELILDNDSEMVHAAASKDVRMFKDKVHVGGSNFQKSAEVACGSGCLEIVDICLLRSRIPIDLNRCMKHAIQCNSVAGMKYLFGKGVTITQEMRNFAKTCNRKEAANFLDNPFESEEMKKSQRLFLNYATIGNYEQVLHYLNIGVGDKEKALKCCAVGGHTRIADLLIARGAKQTERAFLEACKSGNITMVKYFLKLGGMPVDHGLILANKRENEELDQVLIEHLN